MKIKPCPNCGDDDWQRGTGLDCDDGYVWCDICGHGGMRVWEWNGGKSNNQNERKNGMILSDKTIRDLAINHQMITPFVEAQKREGVISYGLSSYGYDARCADEFHVFGPQDGLIDPKFFNGCLGTVSYGDHCIIPPNSFALARTVEHFCIPRDVMVVCVGKSTYARCGIIVNVTPLEPGWAGQVTLEFSNTTPLPVKIYANEGACQFLFFRGDQPCEVSYADRAGKYQDQSGITLPRL